MPPVTGPLRLIKVMLARLHLAWSWPGWAGLVLMAATAAVALGSQLAMGPEVAEAVPESVARDQLMAQAPVAVREPQLLDPERLPQVMAGFGKAAGEGSLTVGRTTFQHAPPTADAPAHLVLRSSLKGAYPDLRRFISNVLRDHAGAALMELVLSRPTVDLDAIEARVAFAFFLATSAASSLPPGSNEPPGLPATERPR